VCAEEGRGWCWGVEEGRKLRVRREEGKVKVPCDAA